MLLNSHYRTHCDFCKPGGQCSKQTALKGTNIRDDTKRQVTESCSERRKGATKQVSRSPLNCGCTYYGYVVTVKRIIRRSLACVSVLLLPRRFVNSTFIVLTISTSFRNVFCCATFQLGKALCSSHLLPAGIHCFFLDHRLKTFDFTPTSCVGLTSARYCIEKLAGWIGNQTKGQGGVSCVARAGRDDERREG